MDVIADVAAVAVGIAFLVAGSSKLAALESWRRQAADLGAPTFSVMPLPIVELIVGASLIVGLVKPFAAILAIAMLVAFTALLALRLSQGRRPACACFGAWSASPIGPKHLVRNGVLLALAVIALGA